MDVTHDALSGAIQYTTSEGAGAGSVHHRHAMDHSDMISGGEDLSDCPSTPDTPTYADDPDLMAPNAVDDVVAQLAASGPVGVAAAEAINTNRRKRKSFMFETNPSIRKRQQTRLLRKLRSIIDEYTMRVGQQAVLVTATPGKPNHNSSQTFKVFGSQPLEDVMRSCKSTVMHELETALAQRAPNMHAENSALFELPPLIIDGMPTAVDKMTQAQLRNFIPEMLKYSTSRSKPGWGKPDCRPQWWPVDLPWANVRCDIRSAEEKKRVPWTQALRSIVKNCYKHHGRQDLLPSFEELQGGVHPGAATSHAFPVVQTINNPDGSITIINIDPGDPSQPQNGAHQVLAFADGTHATVIPTMAQSQEVSHAVQTIGDVGGTQVVAPTMDGTSVGSLEIADGGDMVTQESGTLILEARVGPRGIMSIPASIYSSVDMAALREGQATQHIVHHQTIQAASPEDTDDGHEDGGGVTVSATSGDLAMKGSDCDRGDTVPAATQAVEVVAVNNT